MTDTHSDVIGKPYDRPYEVVQLKICLHGAHEVVESISLPTSTLTL